MREKRTCPYENLPQMPTAQLDQILQAELEKEHPNQEVVLPILKELEEREQNLSVANTPEILEMKTKLSKHNTPSKQSIYKSRWIAAAAVAAVLCLIIMTFSPSVQAESFWDVLVRWTSSVFEFFTPEQDAANPPVEVLFETDHPGLQQVYDCVTDLGVKELVVPMWLPKGFELTEIKETPIAGGNSVYCKFKNGTNDFSITYRISTDILGKIEKKETSVEVFESGGCSHFIVENNNDLSVTWAVDGVECLLNTNVEKDNLYSIIKSIYRSELS